MTSHPAALAATPAAMRPATVVVLLTLLLGVQPVTTDLYLPALPMLMRELHSTVSLAQYTLSALIICFGFGQLMLGPVADRFGRRPVLLFGCALYTLASLGSAAAPGMGWLILWRALQGVAMAALVTCGRSAVRDLYAPQDGAHVMSRALTGLGAIATLCPLIGGALVQWFGGWRTALMALALFGAGTLAFVALRFSETVPARNPTATRLAPLWRNWAEITRHRTFRAWVTLSSLTYGGLFLMLAGSSFVFIDVLGVSRLAFGAVLFSCSVAYTGGTFLCRRLLLAHGLRGAAAVGGGLSLAGGLSMALLSLAGVHSAWAITVPQWLYAMGHGIHQPCGQAGAVGPFPEKAGTAASLSGFFMTLLAFAVSIWIGHNLNGSVYPLTLGMGAFGIAIAAVAWTLVQRHGDPHTPPSLRTP